MRTIAVAFTILALAAGCATTQPGGAFDDLAGFTKTDLQAAIAYAGQATDEGAPYRVRCYQALLAAVEAAQVPGTGLPAPKGVVSGFEIAAQLSAKARDGVDLIPVAVKADCAFVQDQIRRFAVRGALKVAPIPGAGAIGNILR